MTEDELKCSISGSFFKFKPESDLTIDEFKDLKVTVLAPDKGWLYIPKAFVRPEDMKWRPLPNERGMSPSEVEDSFLTAIRRSDFLYIENPGGYIGEMVCFEIGFAFGRGKMIFSREKIVSSEYDLAFQGTINNIIVASPAEARDLFIESGEERNS